MRQFLRFWWRCFTIAAKESREEFASGARHAIRFFQMCKPQQEVRCQIASLNAALNQNDSSQKAIGCRR